MRNILFYDTETTGLIPKECFKERVPSSEWQRFPRVVELGFALVREHDGVFSTTFSSSFVIKPDGFVIPAESEAINGISHERAMSEGYDLRTVLKFFRTLQDMSQYLGGHNIRNFDGKLMRAECARLGLEPLTKIPAIDTMLTTIKFCQLKKQNGSLGKMPKLVELHEKLFNKDFENAHTAEGDVLANVACFVELFKIGVFNSDIYAMADEKHAEIQASVAAKALREGRS